MVHPQRLTEINSIALRLRLQHLTTDPDWDTAKAYCQLVNVYLFTVRVNCLSSLLILSRKIVFRKRIIFFRGTITHTLVPLGKLSHGFMCGLPYTFLLLVQIWNMPILHASELLI